MRLLRIMFKPISGKHFRSEWEQNWPPNQRHYGKGNDPRTNRRDPETGPGVDGKTSNEIITTAHYLYNQIQVITIYLIFFHITIFIKNIIGNC